MGGKALRRKIALVAVLSMLAGSVATAVASAAAPPAPFFNGFETRDDAGTMTNSQRVRSGVNVNGVISATGAFHGEALGGGSSTTFGGYSSVFPTGGYTTSIDIYLDMAKSSVGSDNRAAWSSAINDAGGNHLRDFIFSFGTDGSGGFVMNVSNDTPGWPAIPDLDSYTIPATGWYTFQHTFYDDGGVLAVAMSVLDSSATVLETWTLSDPSDLIGTTVGGNRDGRLVHSGFDYLAIDNVTRSGASIEPEPEPELELELQLKDRKQAVLDELSALDLTGKSKKDDKKLEKALEHLEKSLNPDYWVDGDTLVAKDGQKVFDEESKAVKDLEKIKNADVSGAIASLVAIDKELAQGAIKDAQDRYDAICSDPTTKECKKAAKELDKAQKEIDKALKELDKGHSHHAIGKYKKAWEKADKALKALSELDLGGDA